jgi:hypothetical protein
MRARVSVVAVATALTATLVGAPTAGACSCAFIPPKKLMKRADGAFNGRLLGVELSEGTSEAAFRYRVGQVFKGPFRRGRVVTVWSQDDDAACGLPQTTGVVYGLFVWREEERWASGLCAVVSPRQMRRAARDGDSSTASARKTCARAE